jgi:hypothetical protein
MRNNSVDAATSRTDTLEAFLDNLNELFEQ